MKHPLLAAAAVSAAFLFSISPARAERNQVEVDGDIHWSPLRPQVSARGSDNTPHILYMNMTGPTMECGNDDARTNRSSIVCRSPSNDATFTPFKAQDPEGREALNRCVKRLFGRFGIEVVTEDPGAVNHIEAVVTGGASGEAYLESSILGVSPGCSIIPYSVVYVFGAFYDNEIQQICETVGQEVAHSLGLDHEGLCEDPMTYDGGCGPKTFQDVDAPCRENETGPARNCRCTESGGGATQNSVRTLLRVLGPPEAIDPTVTIDDPANSSTVSGPVTMHITANDNYIIDRVELFKDGGATAFQTDNAPPFEFPLPRNIQPGAHEFRAVAYDAASNSGEATVSLTYEAECSGDEGCDTEAGEICADFYCAQPIGGVCETQDNCAPGLNCGVEELEQRCTRTCGDGFEGCPGGFECLVGIGGAGKCWPGAGGGGGCAAAAVGTRRGGLGLAAGLLLGLALLLRTRRKR